MTARMLGLVALLAVASACVHQTGGPPTDDSRVISPRGIMGGLMVPGTRQEVSGELLAVEDSGYVLLVKDRVSFVPYIYWTVADFPPRPALTIFRVRGVPSGPKVSELRSHARYPFGMPAPALSALLARAGQQSADTIRFVAPP